MPDAPHPASDGLPRPRLTFQVGVTGHRALPGADENALQAQAAALFGDLAASVRRLHARDQAGAAPIFQPSPPVLRCVSGLAQGADTLLAEAALSQGWALVAALPFPADEFAQDFAEPPARAQYRALLARAASVCELAGDRDRGGEPYAEIGQQIVDQADLLLAIWDGLPPRGPGGTGDVVRQAMDRGLPVAVMPPTGAGPMVWHHAGTIDALLAACLLPPAASGAFPQAAFTEAVGERWAARVVRWFERSVLAGVSGPPPAVAFDTEPASALVLASEADLLPVFRSADRLAIAYAARFRAAGLLRYGLILPATFGAFLATFGPAPLRPAGDVLQFAALVCVVAFSIRGRWERWHTRFIAYRGIAEYVRNVRLLAPLGAAARLPGTAVHQARAVEWTVWYGHMTVRAAGLCSARLDAEAVAGVAAFVRDQAAAQLAYLQGRADRYDALAGRLYRIGIALFGCGIGLAGIRTALKLLHGAQGATPPWFDMAALIVPALAPVFFGLLAFGEYSRLATRYRAVAAELAVQLAHLGAPATGRAAVVRIAGRIADIMLQEASDWQLLIKARTISAF